MSISPHLANLTDIGTQQKSWPYTLTNCSFALPQNDRIEILLPFGSIRVEVYVSLLFSCNGQLIFSYVVILLGVQLTFVVSQPQLGQPFPSSKFQLFLLMLPFKIFLPNQFALAFCA
jgi:hypothetical protein